MDNLVLIMFLRFLQHEGKWSHNPDDEHDYMHDNNQSVPQSSHQENI